MNMQSITVVYEFSSEEVLDQKKAVFNVLFNQDESGAMRITAMSCSDEITKLDLIEYGHEIGDLQFIGKVIASQNIPELLEIMKSSTDYADDHARSISAASEYIMEA